MKGDCSGGFEEEAGRIALYIIYFWGTGSILSLLKRDFQVKVISVIIYMVQPPLLLLALGEEVFSSLGSFEILSEPQIRNPVG